MAASMARGRSCFTCLSQSLSRTRVRNNSSAYYVLIPEIPPDTPETNPILRNSEFPPFSSINPQQCVNGCARLSLDFETKLGIHVEKLKDLSVERTFENVFHPIEEVLVPLNNAWRTAKLLNYVKGNWGFGHAFFRVHPQVWRAKNECWVNEALFYAVKEVGQDSGNLDDFQQRLVDLYLMEGRLNGVELQGKNKRRFMDTMKILNDQRIEFRRNVIHSQKKFNHRINNFSLIETLPKELLTKMAEDRLNPTRGPWNVTLDPDIYEGFMKHCSERTLRWNAWQAFNGRASNSFISQNLANHKLLDEIRTHKRDLAMLLGYDNYAQMSMETKMAGSVENVLNVIETLKTNFRGLAEEDKKVLEDLAASEGFSNKLQMWDVDYWRHQHNTQMFKLDHGAISEYFPLEKVLSGLFSLCSQLFGVSFKEATGEVQAWHEDVRFFRVYDEHGNAVNSFFFDPYARHPGKLRGAWMETGKDRSDLVGSKSYSYLMMDLPPPLLKDGPTLLTFKNVQRLFHEFGHGLQQMLSRVPYSELAGQKNVEWDAVQVCAKFMLHWLMVPSVVYNLSGHFETGAPLPSDVVDKLLQAQKHMVGLGMMTQLYYSALDMEFYISKTNWVNCMTNTWEEFMLFPLSQDNQHPCSFTHVIAGDYSAAYYSFLWAEMLAADLFDAFREVGLENHDKVAVTGRRFRDTYLSLGGGLSASEIFRQFRGRDPSVDALLVTYGAKK